MSSRTSAQRILVIEDPDGNTVSLAEMLLPAPREGVSTVGATEGAKGPHPLELALESIAAEPRLSAHTVTDFLDNLIVDLEALLRASEESMTGLEQGIAAQLLQRAHIVRDKVAPSSTPA